MEIRFMIGMKTMPIYNTVGADTGTDADLYWWSDKTFLCYCLFKGVDPWAKGQGAVLCDCAVAGGHTKPYTKPSYATVSLRVLTPELKDKALCYVIALALVVARCRVELALLTESVS